MILIPKATVDQHHASLFKRACWLVLVLAVVGGILGMGYKKNNRFPDL